MKYTINEFAQEIRKLYPGDYDDLSNDELVKLWLKKFPQDKEKIDYTIKREKVYEREDKEFNNYNTPKKQNNGFKIFKRVLVASILIAIVGIGIVYFLNSGTIDENFSDSTYKEAISNNPFDEITINESISNKVDNSDFIKSLSLSGEEIVKMKKILSDSNPDPESKSGEYCGGTEYKCKWCGSAYYVNRYYTSIQEYMNKLMVFDGISAALINTQRIIGVDPASEFRQYINSYEKGDKYTCENERNSGFCSKKCENEEKYSRY